MTNLTMQLYSARNTDLHIALKTIAKAGYSSVEAYGANFENATEFQNGLKANGLTLASSHVGIELLENELSAVIEQLSAFGTTHVVCPFLLPEQRPIDTAGWVVLANRLVVINEALQNHGFTFAWHNHDFEFEALADGNSPMKIILDTAASIHWELDIGWIVRAGQDPKRWLQNYATRISAVHLKDVAALGECADEDGWADVGHGTVDWSSLVNDIKQTSAKHFVIEHDNPSDFARFATNSFNSITAWNW